MDTKNGGPAFPFLPTQDRHATTPGMTLRDYFAAKAMQALIEDGLKRDGSATVPNVAKDAYRMADAMLAARGEA